MAKVFWCIPRERTVYGEAFDAFIKVAFEAGASLPDSIPLQLPYARTDQVRTTYAEAFLSMSAGPDDVLVMLDSDMQHPPTVLPHLASHDSEHSPVGLLYCRRGEPWDPCAFNIDLTADYPATYQRLVSWEEGLGSIDFVSTGAIAIRRWVFERLPWPWFVYQYDPDYWRKWGRWPGEDVYFAKLCMEHGITHWLDTSLISRHLVVESIGAERWQRRAAP
jgi:hypothetical protein